MTSCRYEARRLANGAPHDASRRPITRRDSSRSTAALDAAVSSGLNLALEELGGFRRDAVVMSEGGRHVVHAAADPRMRDRALVRLKRVSLQILQGRPDTQPQLVRHAVERPVLGAVDAPRHQGVAPIQAARLVDLKIEPLIESRTGKRDDGVPMRLKLPVPFNDVAMPNHRRSRCRRWMDLEGGLRRQDDACTGPDANRQIAARLRQTRRVPSRPESHTRHRRRRSFGRSETAAPHRRARSLFAPPRASNASSRRARRPISDARRESGNRVIG